MPRPKIYTEEQEQIILSNAYKKTNKLTYQELADMLNKSVEGIRKKELDLKRKHMHNKRADDSIWSKEEVDYLYEVLKDEDYSLLDIKKVITKDIKLIEAKALEVRIDIKMAGRKHRLWTVEEEEYLKKWHGIKRPITIAIKLGRTLEGIHLKAKKLKLGGKKTYYSARECAQIIGMTDSRFLNHLYKGRIKSKKAVTEQLIHQIKLDDLLEFMEKYQDLWDSRNMAYEPFLIEKPQWYIEKCKRDRENPVGYLDYKKWTDEKTEKLYAMRIAGKSFEEIGEVLNIKPSTCQSKWNKRSRDLNRKLEMEEKRELKAIKEKEEETLNRLKQEMKNERAYIERKVYKIKARKRLLEDDIEMLSTLRMLGYDNKEIEEMTNVYHRTVVYALNRCKDEDYVVHIRTKKDKISEEECEDLFKKANEGYSMYDLALEFHMSYDYIMKIYETVFKNKYDNSIDGNKCKKWTKEDEEKLLKYREQGLNNKQIAYKLNKTASAIRSKIYILSKQRGV